MMSNEVYETIKLGLEDAINGRVTEHHSVSCWTDAPMVEYAPVKHGHWEIVPNDENRDDYYKMRCSVCGETLWSIQSEELYCCKCGAKMDGKEQ